MIFITGVIITLELVIAIFDATIYQTLEIIMGGTRLGRRVQNIKRRAGRTS
jgi:hypothetical protein